MNIFRLRCAVIYLERQLFTHKYSVMENYKKYSVIMVMEIYKIHCIEDVFTLKINNYNIDPDHLFDFIFYIPVNIFSFMLGRVSLG